MEDIYFTASVVAFALAACSLVASIVIFVRADVPNAIRFLRHQPVKQGRRGKVVIPKAAPKKSRRRGTAAAPAGDDRVTAPPGADKPTEAVSSDGEASERPTGLLDEDASERPTGLLGGEDSEGATGLLEEDASERPTGLLDDEASERPTGVLTLEPAEHPTEVLTESAAPSRESAQASAVAQHEETTFRFILKHNEVVVHTQETID